MIMLGKFSWLLNGMKNKFKVNKMWNDNDL